MYRIKTTEVSRARVPGIEKEDGQTMEQNMPATNLYKENKP